MANIPIILLAAGDSTRMGRPKQLLPWGNQTLIEHQIQNLLKTGNPVNVVLGSDSDLVIPVIGKFNVAIFINYEWKNGMGSSIALGIKKLSETFPESEGVLIALLDQPLVTSAYIQKMLDLFQPGDQQIIASQSASGWIGVPALFDQSYFNELRHLNGEEGARKIIQIHNNAVKCVQYGNRLEDMDTPEAYQKMSDSFFNKP